MSMSRPQGNFFPDDGMPIEVVLSNLAAGEGCDGTPYDEMEAGAREIRALRARVAELESALKKIAETDQKGLGFVSMWMVETAKNAIGVNP